MYYFKKNIFIYKCFLGFWRLLRAPLIAILERQERQGWGAKVVDPLAQDLQREFPEQKGFSPRNLKYMRAFASAWPDLSFVQEVLAQIPWYHHVTLLDKTSSIEREWYARAAIEHGWSRAVLVHQIESGLYRRQGKSITNFPKSLPSPQSELAQQTLKDPYLFDFFSVGQEASERDIENALFEHITRFLLELGSGFAYVGRQVHLEVLFG